MKQHYLPKCYLKEFALDTGWLWTLQMRVLDFRHVPRPRRYTPDEICKDIDIYTIDVKLQKEFHIIPLHEYTIEQDIFKAYEDVYPVLINKIKNKNELSYDEYYLFLRIIISIKLRNRFIKDFNSGIRFQETIAQIFDDFATKYVKGNNHQYAHLSEDEREIAVEQVKSTIQADPDFERSMYLGNILQRELRPDGLIAQLVNKMMLAKWKILTAPDDTKFVTSDNPGFCIDESGLYENTKFAEGMFIFPLTPNYCLIIDHKDPDDAFWDSSEKAFYYQLTSKESVAAINQSSGFFINQYLIASEKTLLDAYLNN